MTLGLALTPDLEVQVLSAYVAGLHDIDAVVATPGWYVAGAFRMPETEDVRLEIIGNVSDVSLTLRSRLFAVRADDGTVIAAPVSGSLAQLSVTVTSRALSGIFTLPGGVLYEIQFEIVGGASTSLFGNLVAAQVSNT